MREPDERCRGTHAAALPAFLEGREFLARWLLTSEARLRLTKQGTRLVTSRAIVLARSRTRSSGVGETRFAASGVSYSDSPMQRHAVRGAVWLMLLASVWHLSCGSQSASSP